MAEASIPVDLLNPGEVFASLGFLEAADVLLGDAVGGFDWNDDAKVRFVLRAAGERNPVEEVLKFLATAKVAPCVPVGYITSLKTSPHERECFPGRDVKEAALPCRFENEDRYLDVGHWADGSTREAFKQFAGQQSAHETILPSLLTELKNMHDKITDLTARPFADRRAMRATFKYDARAAWKDRDVGYSLDEQKHLIAISPVVEILAAVGLEHARPRIDDADRLRVHYGAWGAVVPPILARPALGGVNFGLPQEAFRAFSFIRNTQGPKGEYKQVTFAAEENRT